MELVEAGIYRTAGDVSQGNFWPDRVPLATIHTESGADQFGVLFAIDPYDPETMGLAILAQPDGRWRFCGGGSTGGRNFIWVQAEFPVSGTYHVEIRAVPSSYLAPPTALPWPIPPGMGDWTAEPPPGEVLARMPLDVVIGW